jgi:hypothetical protein
MSEFPLAKPRPGNIAGYWLVLKNERGQLFGVSHNELERYPQDNIADAFSHTFDLPEGLQLEIHHYKQPSIVAVLTAQVRAFAVANVRALRSIVGGS